MPRPTLPVVVKFINEFSVPAPPQQLAPPPAGPGSADGPAPPGASRSRRAMPSGAARGPVTVDKSAFKVYLNASPGADDGALRALVARIEIPGWIHVLSWLQAFQARLARAAGQPVADDRVLAGLPRRGQPRNSAPMDGAKPETRRSPG